MTEDTDKLNELHKKLDLLLKRQDDYSKEIDTLKTEITILTGQASESEIHPKDIHQEESTIISEENISEKIKQEEIHLEEAVLIPAENISAEIKQEEIHMEEPVLISLENPSEKIKQEIPQPDPEMNLKNENRHSDFKSFQRSMNQKSFREAFPSPGGSGKGKSDIEKFIGENLLNKVGIAITILGVGIGVKYSIDNDLLSPLTRIILGYLFGLGLLGVGLKLKNKYENYSAVLVSGAMAIMYLVTYSAYGLYNLMPQIAAFILMVLFTAFTVITAINYNLQIIAHIGLVGAYAVPFLLSDGSGKVEILFSYIAILNIGIFATALKKYWKPLYYASFALTWVMFLSWYFSKYQIQEHFGLALVFLSIFFIIFYLTFLAYKLIQNEKSVVDDIILLLFNSFIYYGIGYSILDQHTTGTELLGLYTLCNALIHFIVSVIIYRQKPEDKNLHYLITSLVLVFLTITVPIQLDGDWVTLLWAGQAALMFGIGRMKNISFYEKISFPLMVVAFFSIHQDWNNAYNTYLPFNPETRIPLFFNVHFLTSVFVIAALGFINILNLNKNYTSAWASYPGISKIISYSIPAFFIYILYFTFHLEISSYWNQLYEDSQYQLMLEDNYSPDNFLNYDLIRFKTIWLINYFLVYVSILSFANFIQIKNQRFGYFCISLTLLAILIFLFQGLYILSKLRESYIAQIITEYYQSDLMNMGIRYISFGFLAVALITCYKNIQQEYIQADFRKYFEYIFHITNLWICSSELIHWMDISGSTQSYKLGLSILWGIYAVFLIVYGIWKKKKSLRIAAIALFGITLAKLFLYDISHLDTLARTIVFISLGLMMLIISFLYNKYKHLISHNENKT